METKERLEIKVRSDQMEWLRDESHAQRCSIGELVRLAVDRERQAREASPLDSRPQPVREEGKP